MAGGLNSRGSTSAWRKLRLVILARDGGRCQIVDPATGLPCGKPATHVDHIVPRALGGTDLMSNLRAACQHCNLSRGAGPGMRSRPRGGSTSAWRKLRDDVLERDGHLCRWPSQVGAGPCLRSATTVVHVELPLHGGAEHHRDNLLAACPSHARDVYRRAATAGARHRNLQRALPPDVPEQPRSWSW